MDRGIVRLAMLASGLLLAAGVRAEPGPLTAQDLARCASQVETLRADSDLLTQRNFEYDVRRKAINERSAALKAERDNVDPTNLAAGLAVREKLKVHHEQTLAFNADVERLRRDIHALNALKKDYDSRCAGRPYRRADLEAMPESARTAMGGGLGGVRVPYIEE